MPASRQLSAFTLVELLVVIAIIGILAALLLPVVGMIRDQAHTVACSSNQRQIGLALLTYAIDNRQAIPPIQIQGDNRRASYGWDFRGPTGAPNNFGGAWTGFVAPYIENFTGTTLFLCPAWLKRQDYDVNAVNGLATLYAGSYGMNSNLWWGLLVKGMIGVDAFDIGGKSIDGNYGTVRLTMISNPSNQIWMAEHWGVNTANVLVQQCATDAPWDAGRPPLSGRRRAADVAGQEAGLRLSHGHGTRSTYLFVDGSVRSMTVVQSGATFNARPNAWLGEE